MHRPWARNTTLDLREDWFRGRRLTESIQLLDGARSQAANSPHLTCRLADTS